jgi:thiamine biosynthesis lipoprotein
VSSRNKDVALDFGGYLKGVALDRAAASLKADGIANALINIGGNVMALGTRDGAGTPWRVGIQHPRPQGRRSAAGDAGTARRRGHRHLRRLPPLFRGGRPRYCHLLDPRTGFPATGTQAVTVLITPGTSAGMKSDACPSPFSSPARNGVPWRGSSVSSPC